ncbi:MAG: hypothetical protein RIS76_1499, partial [Verrucomicrobiota bacterium]
MGSSNVTTSPARTAEILAQLGVELAFVEPDRDTGLLPINSLVMDLEEFALPASPPAMATAVSAARAWLDQTLDGSGKFTAETIGSFTQWHEWMTSALTAWERNEVLPMVPTAWARPANPTSAGVSGPYATGLATAPAVPATLSVPVEEEPAIRLNLEADGDLLHEFHAESLELLQNIEQGVLILEKNPKDPGTINSVFRAFHTFKGGAGFLHLNALRDLAHDLESLLDAARRSELQITSGIIDLILAGGDALRQFTREIGLQIGGTHAGAPIVVPTRHLIRRVKAALRGESEPAPPPAAPVIASPAPPPLPLPVPSPTPATPARATAGVSPPAAAISPTAPPSASPSAGADAASGFVKLETRKLDSLVDLVGELVIAQSMVIQDPDVQRLPSRQLARCLRQLGRITTELQRTAMSLRMVPIRGVFQKMARLVRDLAAQQQKEVQLVLEGEETELDRNIVEELGDPLV